tara:strand:- start:390 stop:1337 length:948 start_codon:yes stop_codon:yes gene_type:complete
MSARQNEAKPKPGKASRFNEVLRLGEERKEKYWVRLPPDIAPQIIGLVKSPLQTCEIVRVLHNDGWYKHADSDQLLQLIRLLFFDIPPSENGAQKLAALAHVQQVLVNNFEPIDEQNPEVWLKKMLRRLCEGYTRASTAIRAMERIQPWEGGFEWGTGTDDLSIEIPSTATWSDGTKIDAFVPLLKAKILTENYRLLLAAEEEEKQNMKKRVERCLQSPLHRPRGRCREPASLGYNDIYIDWVSSREDVEGLLKAETPSVRSLPKEFNDSAWLPVADKRMRLSSVIMDTTRVKPYTFYAKDVINGGRDEVLVDVE